MTGEHEKGPVGGGLSHTTRVGMLTALLEVENAVWYLSGCSVSKGPLQKLSQYPLGY